MNLQQNLSTTSKPLNSPINEHSTHNHNLNIQLTSRTFEGFFHCNKFVVVIAASTSSIIDLQIFVETLTYDEIEKTWLQKP